MGTFAYSAVEPTGKTVKGMIDADSAELARQALAVKGLIPVEVKPGGTQAEGFNLEKLKLRLATVKPADLILFTKQIKTMFAAGISIITLLDILKDQAENPKLKAAVTDIADDIRQGSNLYNAFKRHDTIFSHLYCSMLRAGETAGTLPEVLERLIYIIEHEYRVKKQITSAMVYPIIVVVLLVGAFFFLLTFVVPKFAAIFATSTVPLPMPTKICMTMYDWLMSYWYILVGGVFGAITALVLYVRTEIGNLNKDRLFLRMPLIGPVVTKASMSRFASIFAILQSSGVSVIDSMNILADTIGNAAISLEFKALKEKLEEGKGIAGPLRSSRQFPPMVVSMVAIGEESGNLDHMMQEVANHYDYEVEHAVARMTELIGPILLCALTGVVGFFALAIYLPMVDMIKAMKPH